MEVRIGLFSRREVAVEMGKGTAPAPTWAPGGRRVEARGARLGVTSAMDDAEMKATMTTLLTTQLKVTQQRGVEDPRRHFAETRHAATRATRAFVDAYDDLISGAATPASEKQLLYEQETWQLIESLLDCGGLLREGVLNWVQLVSKRCVSDALLNCMDGSDQERFWTVMAWLVAANLNVDAARLAIAEGELDLSQLLMCRFSPDLMMKLMKSFRERRSNMHPRFRAILDLLSGNSEALLNELQVDWRIRLGTSLSKVEGQVVSLQHLLDVFHSTHETLVAIDDLQFQILMLFAKMHEGEDINSDSISQILQIDMSSMQTRDICLKWQIFTVLSAAGVLNLDNISEDAICQLYHTLCDQCEALGMPEWSVFVCLHQPLPLDTMESQIERILSTNVTTWIHNSVTEAFLLNELKLSLDFIMQAKAQWFKQMHQPELEFECLAAIGEFNQAHTLLMQQIVPNLITSTQACNLGAVIDILKEKQFFQNQHSIIHWKLGGGLLYAIYTLLLQRNLPSYETLPLFAEPMQRLEREIAESQSLWSRIFVTDAERRQIHRIYDILSYKIEHRYYELYAAVNGADNILARILFEKCSDRERQLSLGDL